MNFKQTIHLEIQCLEGQIAISRNEDERDVLRREIKKLRGALGLDERQEIRSFWRRLWA